MHCIAFAAIAALLIAALCALQRALERIAASHNSIMRHAVRCAMLVCSAALQPNVLRVEVPLRPSMPSQQQPLWDSPLSLNDAVTQQIPMLSSAPIETEAGERFRVDVYP